MMLLLTLERATKMVCKHLKNNSIIQGAKNNEYAAATALRFKRQERLQHPHKRPSFANMKWLKEEIQTQYIKER